MKIFISVISHGHDILINKLGCLQLLSNDFDVIIKSNKQGDRFDELASCKKLHWIDSDYGLGFGHNNNVIFSYCINNLDMKDDDLFIVFNPDVSMNINDMYELASLMKKDNTKLSCINLFKDDKFSIYDNSVRKFPKFMQFIKSFLGGNNNSILDKNKIHEPMNVDWAAGSFLAFSVKRYKELQGFDEKYFMYCEDIDICYRSHQQGCPVVYYPQVKALHYAKHENRKLFSKHLYWHISSVFRFLLTKKGLTKPSSSLVD
ncbi:glycosyltransferase family 2 protein [Photobacterium carnosum]|uniref:glycosyltransferase family 2 protein n=1 Tax=Photobacterium carnosum TaxID=2023717 RepID=UPI001E4FFA19|nr:glycosyltransferase family 2 protein [Photobacterium carnosum]MCD9529100.1 glycosyltransferase family 2 protein [Photobacterium carnosum]